jgi:thiol-disulfide isomerase/thioredoxin
MNYIKTKIFIMAFLLLSASMYGKENSLKFIPEKPKTGDEVIVVYNPAGTPLENVDSMKIIFSLYSKKCTGPYGIENTYSFNMEKQGNNWTVKIKTSAITDMGAIKFKSGIILDINDKKGYFLKLYDSNGNETIGSIMGSAICSFNWGGVFPLSYYAGEKETAAKNLNGLFNTHPELKTVYFNEYLILQRALSAEDRTPSLISELSEYEKRNDLSEKEYGEIIRTYLKLKMPDKVSEVTLRAIKSYPKGIYALTEVLNSIKNEKDLVKQFEMTKKELKYYTDAGYASKLAGEVFQMIIEKADPKFIEDYIIYMLNEGAITYKSSSQYSDVLIKNKNNLDLALTLTNIGVDGWSKIIINPSMEKTSTVTEEFNYRMIKDSYCLSLLRHASVLSLLNRKEEVIKDYEKIFSLRSLKQLDPTQVENYLRCLPEEKKYEVAVPIIEEYYKSGKVSESLKTLLKEIYVKKTGSEEEYEKYIKRIESESEHARLERLKKEIANKKPAPEFILADFNGKKVSLSDYKGKIVILDFWATWCGWCKKSFPQMQQAVEKYAGKDVVFLFVDTMEKEDNAKEKAKEFITQNNYPFYVIIDTDSKVSKSYGVQGIPAKVFIDKEGNQRYFSKGYSDHIVEEIDEIIELLR